MNFKSDLFDLKEEIKIDIGAVTSRGIYVCFKDGLVFYNNLSKESFTSFLTKSFEMVSGAK